MRRWADLIFYYLILVPLKWAFRAVCFSIVFVYLGFVIATDAYSLGMKILMIIFWIPFVSLVSIFYGDRFINWAYSRNLIGRN